MQDHVVDKCIGVFSAPLRCNPNKLSHTQRRGMCLFMSNTRHHNGHSDGALHVTTRTKASSQYWRNGPAWRVGVSNVRLTVNLSAVRNALTSFGQRKNVGVGSEECSFFIHHQHPSQGDSITLILKYSPFSERFLLTVKPTRSFSYGRGGSTRAKRK